MNITEGFEDISLEKWKAQLEKDLKGVSFEQLSRKDANEITVYPFYNRENLKDPGEAAFLHTEWDICSYVELKDPSEQNKTALQHLNNGANSLIINIGSNTTPQKLFQGIHANYIKVHLSYQEKNTVFIDELNAYLKDKKTDFAQLNGSFVYDPVALLIRGYEDHFETRRNYWKKITEHELVQASELSPFVTDSFIFQNAGCTAVNELALTLAQLNEQLHFISKENINTGNKKFILITSSSINFFENLCKIKALRNLATFLLNEYGFKNGIFIHANTSLINKTAQDAYNNLIRSGIEAMSAIAGGADSVAVAPYDYVTGTHDTNAQRLALNQLLILKEEAFLSKVADVGAGSFYLENYSNAIANKAWEEFKKIENEGGLIQLAMNGKLKEKIKSDAEKMKQDFINGNKILTGVNKFINKNEKVSPRTFPRNQNSKGVSFESIEEWITEATISKT